MIDIFIIYQFLILSCLRHCNLNEYGRQRAYFDFTNMTQLPQFKMNIASGYNATLDFYNEKLLLCVEVAHKILSSQTVLEKMQNIQHYARDNFREECEKFFVGDCHVMTTYINFI